MFDPNSRFDPEEYSAALFERAEDLELYPDAEADAQGLIELNSIGTFCGASSDDHTYLFAGG